MKISKFMKNKKIAYIIPGYGESYKKQPSYNKIANLFKIAGIQAVHVDINWHHQKPRQFSDYVDQFLKQLDKPKGTDIFIFGFSYGATIAFLSESKVKVKALILCSLSPYFKEDIKNLEKDWVKSWKKDFIHSDYSFVEVAKKIHTKTYLCVGKEEHLASLTRARSARMRVDNSELFVVKNAKHNINKKEYLEAIECVIDKL